MEIKRQRREQEKEKGGKKEGRRQKNGKKQREGSQKNLHDNPLVIHPSHRPA